MKTKLSNNKFRLALALLVPVVLQVLFIGLPVRADGELGREEQVEAPSQPVDRSSSNFNKTEKFLPGEEVQTPSGKRVKVWSTRGPVPVSRAPEPFEDREKTVLDNSHIVIDAEANSIRRHSDRVGSDRVGSDRVGSDRVGPEKPLNPEGHPVTDRVSDRDRFDLRPDPK